MDDPLELLDIFYDDSANPHRMLDIHLPSIAAPYPALIYFHGGGLEGGSRKGGETNVIKRLTGSGIAVISADYSLYPNTKFPEFIEDAAKAVRYAINFGKERNLFSKIFIGGASAGSYISMMLFFDKHYLNDHGIDPNHITGYLFDAGQPTVHFNVLNERGLDTRLVRIDEAAPMYFVNDIPTNTDIMPKLMFLVSDNDIPGRYEQLQLLIKNLMQFGYLQDKISFRLMKGFDHCSYIGATDENGNCIYSDLIKPFLTSD